MPRRSPTPPGKGRFFFGEGDMRAETILAKDFWFKDNPFELTLYRLDRSARTGGHKLYKEQLPGQQQLLPGIPVTGRPTAQVGDTKSGVKGAPKGTGYEKFTFSIFYEELRRKGVEMTEGDYLVYHDGEAERVMEIKDVTRINSGRSVAGAAPFYLKVSCILKDSAAYLLPPRT